MMSMLPLMSSRRITIALLAACSLAALAPIGAPAAQSKDLGNGFTDHGVATPVSNRRGVVATVDGNGRNVVLAYIMDHRGGYELIMTDAETGKTDEFPMPFDNVKMDSPYAAILSSGNKFYTHFGDNFVEFDPVKRAFTFSQKTKPQMSMGMTEDDNGVIWSVTYPDSGVVSYNPKTKEFKDYGFVYDQNWPMYQRYVAADDSGIVYFALGPTASQIVAFDPATGKGTPLLKEEERQKGTAFLYRNKDGKVYGQALSGDGNPWYEIYKGAIRKIGDHKVDKKPIITDSQVLFHKDFPDGSVVEEYDTIEKYLRVKDKDSGETRTVKIDYKSDGAEVMALALAPDGTISGGTAFPMRNFSYNPKTDVMTNRPAYGQWNTVAALGDRFFVGGYPSGYMLEWEPGKPWINTDKNKTGCNPQFLKEVTPVIHRPHCLLPMSDGSAVIMGGTPQYGYTGGGLLIWDRKTSQATVLKDSDLVPDQSARSIMELPGNKVLIGTTTAAGTGGEKKAKQAEIYVFDMATKKITQHINAIPGANEYTALTQGEGSLVYGFADASTLFVLDMSTGQVVHKEDVSGALGRCITPQGPRVFVRASNKLYVLMAKGIAQLDTKTHKLTMLAESPVGVEAGGDYLDGRIYFSHGSHIYSWKIGQ